jgi:hypothetical protein
MPLLSKPAFGPRTAIIYITIGSLIDVWTAVWYMTYARDNEGNISRNTWFWLAGLFLTGLTFIIIGFFLGRIGRAARKAELPPTEAQPDEAAIQQTAAAVPHPVVAGGVMPGTMAGAAPMMGNPMMGGGVAAGTSMQPQQQAPQQFVPGVTRR